MRVFGMSYVPCSEKRLLEETSFTFEALANGNANANGSHVDGGPDASASGKELEAHGFGQGL